jgi:hypothetical protein
LTDYTRGQNSIKKYKLNVNQRRKDKIEWSSGVQPRFTRCKHLWLEDGLTEKPVCSINKFIKVPMNRRKSRFLQGRKKMRSYRIDLSTLIFARTFRMSETNREFINKISD